MSRSTRGARGPRHFSVSQCRKSLRYFVDTSDERLSSAPCAAGHVAYHTLFAMTDVAEPRFVCCELCSVVCAMCCVGLDTALCAGGPRDDEEGGSAVWFVGAGETAVRYYFEHLKHKTKMGLHCYIEEGEYTLLH